MRPPAEAHACVDCLRRGAGGGARLSSFRDAGNEELCIKCLKALMNNSVRAGTLPVASALPWNLRKAR